MYSAPTQPCAPSLHDALPIWLGDEAFFASLNTDAPAAAGWGKRAAAWTPESYAAAAAAPVGDPQHDRLVATLVKEHFSSRSEEHTSELQSRENLVCRLLLEKK